MARIFPTSTLLPGMIEDVDISKIDISKRLLRPIDSIEELATSISQRGLLQPILVRVKHDGNDRFEVVAGNRRLHACKRLGWKKITGHVVELGDRDAFEVSLVENMQRYMLSPLEEAHAFKTYVSDYGWGGISELATKLAKSPSYITKRIKLLNLPSDVLDSINNTSISTSIAEELCLLGDPLKQSQLSQLISKRHLSLRSARKLIKDIEGELVSEDSNCNSNGYFFQIDNSDTTQRINRSFDKSILTLRIALNRLGEIIDELDDRHIIYDLLMYHRNVLHEQIDLLLKEKKKAQNIKRLNSISFTA